MKILIDVCLSPLWVDFFQHHGVDAIHWSAVGACDADDALLFEYAQKQGLMIFTHDLDFGTLLAHTKGNAPSVIQARVPDPSPDKIGQQILQIRNQFQTELDSGAIITLAADRSKVRILPI
jgi:predicted nuclease of predicted toxin-antitoxin system